MANDPTDDTVLQSTDEGSAATLAAPSGRGSATELAPATASGATVQLPVAIAAEVSDRYKTTKVLGQGGMGEVWLAVDERIQREVAVKRIRAEQPSAEELSRFLREALIQGRLEHPAIVPVHDLVYDGSGKPFFVMKRLAGVDMHDRLKALRTKTGDDAAAERRKLLRAFAEVCIAVEFAHVKGIVHRDLKPANVMLGEFGEVYIIDWGIAHASDDADDSVAAPSGRHDLSLSTGDTQAGAVLGTPAYMSPEQLVGDKAGAPSDIYALGCILYEIAAGEPLYTKTRNFTHAFREIDPKPSSKRPDSPPELDTICEKALAMDARDRWQSARALGEAVQNFLEGDRDVVVRKELAQHHLKHARDALAKGGDEDRRQAMQAAGRALALDPTAGDAADLVTRLMLEPPSKVPAEVEAHLEASDVEAARQQGRLATLTMLGYLFFIPVFLWSGVRDYRFLVAYAGATIAVAAQVFLLTRRERLTTAPIYISAVLNAVLIGVIARMVGPFIIAPSLVLTTLAGYASHPRFGNIGAIAGILSLGVAVPWALELTGALEPSYSFDRGDMTLHSHVIDFAAAPTQAAFALLLLSLIIVITTLCRRLALRQRDDARKLELQAWQLRQIVPVAR